MFKYEKSFAKIEALRKKHPNKLLKDLIAAVGATPSEYHRAKRKRAEEAAAAPKAKRAYVKHRVLSAAPPASDDRMIFCMGTPEQIRAVLAGGAL